MRREARDLLREATYVMPIRANDDRYLADEFIAYLRWLRSHLRVVVADGSARARQRRHAAAWGSDVDHLHVSSRAANGKVAGVLDGLARVQTPFVIVADDDVRHSAATLAAVVARLDSADAVVPQNHFEPAPWHARWDTGRTLVNRRLGEDFAGTIGLRLAAAVDTNGYCGEALFENLELIRTLRAAGHRVVVDPGLHVPRRPPTARQFWRQRARQAYDSRAQPARWAAELAIAPLVLVVALVAPAALIALAIGVVATAESGRRRAGGRAVFPASASWWALAWVVERAMTSWGAVWLAARGGVRYAGSRLSLAGHSPAQLARSPRSCPGGCGCRLVGPAALTFGGGHGSLTAYPSGPVVGRRVARVRAPERQGGIVDLANQRFLVGLCRCGKSGRLPFCDSTHRKLPAPAAWPLAVLPEARRGGSLEVTITDAGDHVEGTPLPGLTDSAPLARTRPAG